ncbi:hypothetical protein ACFV0G_39590, partial [Kitasatospora sp. NPDC059571]
MTAVPEVPEVPAESAVPAGAAAADADAAAAGAPVLRPITGPDEVGLFNRLSYRFNHEIAGDLADGRRRPEWTWLALDGGGRLLARAAWWCRPGDTRPYLLDVLDHLPGHRDTAEALLRRALAEVVPAGTVPPNYTRFLPPGWRTDPAVGGRGAGRAGGVGGGAARPGGARGGRGGA